MFLLSFEREVIMLHYATVFLVLALVAGILGIGAVAAEAAQIAEFMFFLFVMFVVGGVVSALRHRGSPWVMDGDDSEDPGDDITHRASRHE
jgi:uncharacterized membrane protein YtjA (UPF0391 family)